MNTTPSRLSPQLPISLRARRRFHITPEFISETGSLHLPDVHASRTVAETINSVLRQEREDGMWLRASELYAAALLASAVYELVLNFSKSRKPPFLSTFREKLTERLKPSGFQRLHAGIVHLFLDGSSKAPHHPTPPEQSITLLIFLYWAGKNPALDGLRHLFDETDNLPNSLEAFAALEKFLASTYAVDPDGARTQDDLLSLLLEPIRRAPNSLEAQLKFIRKKWSAWIPGLERAILGSLDLLAEENRPHFPPGPGPVEVPDYSHSEAEAPEAYSRDIDWMPCVVLLAKNACVWMAQLSEEYGREISRLDEIPEEELDRLAARGFTGLWLIGVWERSRASEKIKRWMGDENAVASAYSLDDYVIAAHLGGDGAWDELSRKASERGIRLMTDMVPNHVGIDARWVIEHPDWFIGLPDCPFPGYRFSGADLCEDERVGIYIEDGYWDRSDAAVVFKRIDHWTGDTLYIYHGNDGTSMPWNDTAQLDYRKAEVREAVIQTILHVARRSPMIRFDAAMTLTRENFRRLWFPEPGHGGDIPSRSAHAMAREDFDRMMPGEFWREVVDRVAEEAPDTLLLAEAFWMLEGYFVRSLGMHRVYNSAFMNMLRDERNAEYRRLIRETLDFDPRILSRYVNFMSNPDEDTAIAGFGAGDKYFGICTLMATMPGLPMFAHGQIEGFAEKYGMEFHRPRWKEEVNRDLLSAHHRLIFPLLRRRSAFSGVENFRLYNFERPGGEIDENVFVFSNGSASERNLVIVNNALEQTRGRAFRAVPTRIMRNNDPGELGQPDLAESLSLDGSALFLKTRDLVSGLEFLFEIPEVLEQGLDFELQGYEYHVFLDMEEIRDDPGGHWKRLAAQLGGRGCGDLIEELGRLRFSRILEAWKELAATVFRKAPTENSEPLALDLLAAIREEFPSEDPLAPEAMDLIALVSADDQKQELSIAASLPTLRIAKLLSHLESRSFSALNEEDRLLLLEMCRQALDEIAPDELETRPSILLIFLDVLREAEEPQSPTAFLRSLMETKRIRRLLEVHEWEGRSYFRKEGAESLLKALGEAVLFFEPGTEAQGADPGALLELSALQLREAIRDSAWDFDKLLVALRGMGSRPDPVEI